MSRVQAGRAHAEVERDQQVELAFGRLVVPDDLLGLRPPSRAEILALHAVAGAEQVLEEVLVALAARSPAGWSARRTGCAGSSAGASGSSQLMLQRAVLQRLDRVVLRRRRRPPRRPCTTCSGLVCSCGALGSQPMRSARTLKSIRLPRVLVRVGQRREDLLHAELLVAPLVGVRVEERRCEFMLPRRADPVEREGERRPAGLRPQLLLADVVRPAAAGLADAAAHHQHVDDAAVVHVGVVPVVHRRADDDHRLAVRLVGVVGELARHRDRPGRAARR